MKTREMLRTLVQEREAARPAETIAGLACLLVVLFATGLHFWREHSWEVLEAIILGVLASGGLFLLSPKSAQSWATSVITFWRRDPPGRVADEDQG